MDEETKNLIWAGFGVIFDMAQKEPGVVKKMQQLNVKNEQGELENYEITVTKI